MDDSFECIYFWPGVGGGMNRRAGGLGGWVVKLTLTRSRLQGSVGGGRERRGWSVHYTNFEVVYSI